MLSKITPPDSMKRLTACLSCKLVQTQDQFMNKFEKCPNSKVCGTVGLNDLDVFREKTTSNFSGLVSKMEDGWVAKWLHIDGPLQAGVYAIDVKSEMKLVEADDYESDLEADEREVR